jgi:hypothetical protein
MGKSPAVITPNTVIASATRYTARRKCERNRKRMAETSVPQCVGGPHHRPGVAGDADAVDDLVAQREQPDAEDREVDQEHRPPQPARALEHAQDVPVQGLLRDRARQVLGRAHVLRGHHRLVSDLVLVAGVAHDSLPAGSSSSLR